MLPHCLLSWVGQRAPIYLFYTTSRSLNSNAVPELAASFLTSFGALGEWQGAFNAWWGGT